MIKKYTVVGILPREVTGRSEIVYRDESTFNEYVEAFDAEDAATIVKAMYREDSYVIAVFPGHLPELLSSGDEDCGVDEVGFGIGELADRMDGWV